MVAIGERINSNVDFTGNGSGGVLFQVNATPPNDFAWYGLVNGTFAFLGLMGEPAGFTALGHANVFGDGISQIVLEASTGKLIFEEYTVSGGLRTANGPIVPGFGVIGCGDIQADGYGDLVIENSSGVIDYYDTKNAAFVAVGNTPGWSVVGVGNVNGDSYADIVIRTRAPARSPTPTWQAACSTAGSRSPARRAGRSRPSPT